MVACIEETAPIYKILGHMRQLNDPGCSQARATQELAGPKAGAGGGIGAMISLENSGTAWVSEYGLRPAGT